MTLFIITGEPSGDLQGAHLVEALRKMDPHLHISGIAGPRLRALGVEGPFPMEELQVMGFIDVLLALPKIVKSFWKIRKEILRQNPTVVVFVDYPGLNLRLARSLRHHGYKGKLIHYICPTVWAWGKKRIEIMEKTLDLLLTIFPFEKKCFSHTSLPVSYIGHPLVKKVANHISSPLLDEPKKILALFPGSRKEEILRNLAFQLKAAKRLKAHFPDMEIAISLAREDLRPYLQGLPLIEPELRYDLMQKAHLAIATSGTVNLELALFQTPTVVNFAIKPLDLFIAQKIFRIDLPHYCIVNIIAGKTVFPEFFGPNLTEEALFKSALDLWQNPEPCKVECAKVRFSLGEMDAAQEAAEIVSKIFFHIERKVTI